jgi:TPR repeat protein
MDRSAAAATSLLALSLALALAGCGEDIEAQKAKCQAGDADGCFAVASAYGAGYGVEQSLDASTEWALRAARMGHAIAQWNVGQAYERGSGVPADPAEAYFWLRLSTARGHARAGEDATRVGATLSAEVREQVEQKVAGWQPAAQ